MIRENSDSFNPYNIEIRDSMEMDFQERLKPEPVDLRFANFTLTPKELPKQETNNLFSGLLKLLKVV